MDISGTKKFRVLIIMYIIMTQEKFLRQNIIFEKPKDKSLKTAFASIATVPVPYNS